ncbi:MAG: hypothetical protein ONB24_08330 [candidate division KSB1 bacterium]|nr:hypothetical protein [candidate division KSB1 bacterium]
MNPRARALLWSGMIHAGLVVIFLCITFRTNPQIPKLIELQIADEHSFSQTQSLAPPPQDAPRMTAKASSPSFAKEEPRHLPAEPTVEEKEEDHFDAATFFSTPLPALRIEPKDSLKPSIDLTKKNEPLLLARPGPYDPVEREIARRNLGEASLPDPTQAAAAAANMLQPQKNDQEKRVRLDFIPTRAELAVLQSLWEKPNRNDVEIYASLDSTVRITAEDLQGILAKLTAKGLLKRRLISPHNELTLPFGAAVEMSAQNRRNPLYRYEAGVDRQEVIRFLNAVLYELEYGGKGANKDRLREIAALKERLLQAAQ